MNSNQRAPVFAAMKQIKTYMTVAVLALGVFAIVSAEIGRGLAKSKVEESESVNRLASSRDQLQRAAFHPSSLKEAAKLNAQLNRDLQWTFGSKAQRGWYLYVPLISRLINTRHDVTSKEFASAIRSWQARSGLQPSGVLDEETLYAMIKSWQDERLKDRTVAEPGQLLTAPLPDFYDPTRTPELRQVERQTYAAYKRMVAAAVADRSLGLGRTPRGELASGEKYLKIISAFRSREYQDKLRRESPNSGSAGLAVNSPHFTGRALDLYVGGDPVDTQDANRELQVKTRVYQWLVRNAERFGFRPYCYEPWHWEFVK